MNINRSKARRGWLRWERHLARYGIKVGRNGAYRNIPGSWQTRAGGTAMLRAWRAYVAAEMPRWEKRQHRLLWTGK